VPALRLRSYGISIPASFNTNCLSLVDRGFVYAIAHIRGGKEKGFAWYEEGKRGKKTNTFTDFIAAARYLDSENFTSHERIVAQGGSAGGMLMGAVANMAPEAFGAIIAAVPFVDVLNTMLDDTLPLTPPEWPEWGNPVASVEDYRTIAAYSPYDNVTAQAYPPILAVAGLTDPRVTYWEPAKWVARCARCRPAAIRFSSRSTWPPAMPALPGASSGSKRLPMNMPSRSRLSARFEAKRQSKCRGGNDLPRLQEIFTHLNVKPSNVLSGFSPFALSG
jgi:prolyl oligopeptidase PreP (S9A serine peptidase family)